MTDFDVVLSEDELDELQDFLLSEATPDECMDLAMLDGFLTALVIGPRLQPPERWLPRVWGDEEQPDFASREQGERIISLIFRHLNGIAGTLMDEPDRFEPLFYQHEEAGETVLIPDEWCLGFVEGVFLDDDSWRPLLEDEQQESLLEPIFAFGTDQGAAWLEQAEDAAALRRSLVAGIGPALTAIHAFWQPYRAVAAKGAHAKAVAPREPKVGRNDPCPCGSGRKYKQCCGAKDQLH